MLLCGRRGELRVASCELRVGLGLIDVVLKKKVGVEDWLEGISVAPNRSQRCGIKALAANANPKHGVVQHAPWLPADMHRLGMDNGQLAAGCYQNGVYSIERAQQAIIQIGITMLPTNNPIPSASDTITQRTKAMTLPPASRRSSSVAPQ